MSERKFATIDEDFEFYKKCLVDECHIIATNVKLDDKTCVFMCHSNAQGMGYEGAAFDEYLEGCYRKKCGIIKN